jgi:ABC-type transport system involved in multi-copper enzyme maturation permease subunit
MNWLVWRQHRKQFVVLAIILVLYAALAIPMGLSFWHTYQHALATCGKTDTCSQLSNELLQSGSASNLNPAQPSGGVNLIVLLILALPFILGMFIGVPLIAREYNNKTNLLVWARSVSRRKWLTTKLVWILVATALFAGTFAVLTTWWSKTGNALYLNRFDVLSFDKQGIVLVAFAVFAISLGVAFGAWLKRTMVAIGLTLVVLLGMQIAIPSLLRPHYIAAKTYTASINTPASAQRGPDQPPSPPNSSGAWIISGNIVTSSGQLLNWQNPPQKCIVTNVPKGPEGGGSGVHAVPAQGGNGDSIISHNGGPAVDFKCLGGLGYRWSVQYQPSYRYWDFQRIETGLYLALSVIPIGATYWLVLKRDA